MTYSNKVWSIVAVRTAALKPAGHGAGARQAHRAIAERPIAL